MEVIKNIIERALGKGAESLSENESKEVLAAYNIPVTREIPVKSVTELVNAAKKIGYPLVLKGCSADISHKTEKGLVRMDIRNDKEAQTAFEEIMADIDAPDSMVLVQELIKGKRELVVGLTRDPQFGPCVMFGLGGIFTEILKDISFRIAPLEKRDAMEMMQEIKASKILTAIRGMVEVDIESLADILIAVGRIGLENDNIKEIDINPLILSDGKPIAVDALVILEQP